MEELTNDRLRELIYDEEKASREYRELGLNEIAKDEADHARILRRMLK